MRVSIPSLPQRDIIPPTVVSLNDAVSRITSLLRKNRRVLALTGAGVSVDSGISSYRGENGLYLNKGYRPIYYHEFTNKGPMGDEKRHRYWARSYLGYPPVRHAHANETHMAIARLQKEGLLHQLITQNVDRLHHVASYDLSERHPNILELHGSLSEVCCVQKGPKHGETHHWVKTHRDSPHAWWNPSETKAFGPMDRFRPMQVEAHENPGCGLWIARDALQDHLSTLNPKWEEWAKRLETDPSLRLRRNPDGDIQLEGVNYSEFKYPPCPCCGGVLKPDVVFFGEGVRASVRKAAEEAVHQCDALLIVGTTLATHSAYRLAKDASQAGKPVILVNRGPTRADEIIDTRVGLSCSEVMSSVATEVFGN